MLLFAAAGHAGAQTITVGLGSAIENFDPHKAVTFAEHTLAQTLHRGLVQFEADGRIGPGLAEAWEISSNGRTYTFTLRTGLTWSDGSPLRATDIVAGFEHAVDPNDPKPFAAQLFAITNSETFASGLLPEGQTIGVAAPDSQTIVITLDRRTHHFLDTLAQPIAMPLPATNRTAFSNGTLTSGTYQIESQAADGTVTLKPTASGPTLSLQVVNSATEAWTLAIEGNPFLTQALPVLSVPPVGDHADLVRVDGGQALYAYAVNMNRAPFNTVEARHALAMAVQRPVLLRALNITGTEPANHFIAPSVMTGIQSYRAPFASLTYEEREAVAAALLSEHGFNRENPLRVSLRIPQGDVHRAIADSVAGMWATSGIQTEIVESSLPDHWRALDRGDFDVAFMSWPGPRDTPNGILQPLSQCGGPWNFPRYGFADFTERLNRAAQEERPDRRLEYYREAEKALVEDQTLIALFFYSPLVLASPSVDGWIANAKGRHPLTTLSLNQTGLGLQLIRPTLPQAVPSFGEDR